MNNLATAYRDVGRLGEAEPLFREAVTGARGNIGFAHPNTQTYQRNLADCYSRLRQPEKAEPLWRELAAFWKEKAGADSPQYAAELHPLGLSLLEQQKPAEAEPLLRECLKIREAKRPDDWTTFNTQSLLGASLLGQKKYAEAEPLLLAGYEGMKQREAKIPPQARSAYSASLERLVQLYEATGQKDKADEWRKKREQPKARPSRNRVTRGQRSQSLRAVMSNSSTVVWAGPESQSPSLLSGTTRRIATALLPARHLNQSVSRALAAENSTESRCPEATFHDPSALSTDE